MSESKLPCPAEDYKDVKPLSKGRELGGKGGELFFQTFGVKAKL